MAPASGDMVGLRTFAFRDPFRLDTASLRRNLCCVLEHCRGVGGEVGELRLRHNVGRDAPPIGWSL